MYEREIARLDIIKIKNFCFVKETVQRMKKQATDWKKTFAEHVSNKRHVSKKRQLLILNDEGKTQLR